MLTTSEYINKRLRGDIQIKNRMLELARRSKDTVAEKRIEKSIALRVQKLLCEHEPKIQMVILRGGRHAVSHHCDKCKARFTTGERS